MILKLEAERSIWMDDGEAMNFDCLMAVTGQHNLSLAFEVFVFQVRPIVSVNLRNLLWGRYQEDHWNDFSLIARRHHLSKTAESHLLVREGASQAIVV